uniref:hypothetical protein n=1 Tax=Algoriphagus sp. TaxID=1872435 RepID=UPI0040474EF6
MLEQLKEIKEKLNLLIEQVEHLENSIHEEEIIIEKKDFKLLKRLGDRDPFQVFQFTDGVVFQVLGKDKTNYIDHWKYTYSIFKALLDDKLERIILLKRKENLQTKEGFLITHDVEMEVDTKLRDNYRSK